MADLNKYVEQIQNIDFNDLNWERVGVWPFPARVFLFVLAAIALFAATYFLFVKETYASEEVAKREEATLRTNFERKAFEAANLDAYRDQMVKMEESFGDLLAQLPKETEVPGLLEDIDDKGLASSLSIQSIDLLDERATEFYTELPINISVTGGYHEFGAFVSGIAGMSRIVTLHDFKIDKESDSLNGGLKMDIKAKTYRYKADGEGDE